MTDPTQTTETTDTATRHEAALTWREERRIRWIEDELLQYNVDLSNAESGQDYELAEAIGQRTDKLERELDAIWEGA